MNYDSQEFRDLSNLAKDRVREASMSVGQLIEDDEGKTALLIYLAIDLMKGAAFTMCDDEGMTDHEAFSNVLAMVFHAVGIKKVATALKIVMEQKDKEKKRSNG